MEVSVDPPKFKYVILTSPEWPPSAEDTGRRFWLPKPDPEQEKLVAYINARFRNESAR